MKEPEEIIEAKLLAILSVAVPELDTIGALTPCEVGEMKLSEHSSISIFVDLASQNLDFEGPGTPCSYTVRIVVKVAFDDDKDGHLFLTATRRVRAALDALTGDNCAAINSDGFRCDSFMLSPTNTTIDAADGSGAMSKTYNATVAGRYIPPTQEES